MEEGPSLKLIVEKGPREGETFEFRTGSAVGIGRLVRGNKVAIKDAGISSKHLLIVFESGKWVVSDLESSNGTILNDLKLAPMTPSVLSDGDIVKIGEFTSIIVKILEIVRAYDNDNSQIRRNPRRRGRGDTQVLVTEDLARGAGVEKLNVNENNNIEARVETNNYNRRPPPRRAKVLNNNAQEKEIAAESVKVFPNEGVMDLTRERQVGSRKTRSSHTGETLSSDSMILVSQENVCVDGSDTRVTRRSNRRARVSKNESQKSSIEVEIVGKMDNLGSIEPRQTRQGTTRRALRSRKDEKFSSDAVLEAVPENSSVAESKCRDLEIFVIEEGKRQRGRPRGKRKLQSESLEFVKDQVLVEKDATNEFDLGAKQSDCATGVDSQNEQLARASVGGIEQKDIINGTTKGQGQAGTLFASRVAETERVEAEMEPDLKKTTLEESNRPRGHPWGKRNLKHESLERVKDQVLVEKEAADGSSLRAEHGKQSDPATGVDSQSETLVVRAPVGGIEDTDIRNGTNKGQELAGALGASGVDETEGVELGMEPDLEKMTLGEWFDYLEVHLLKQIHDETEAVIMGMRDKAEKFHDFMLQQKDVNRKCSILS